MTDTKISVITNYLNSHDYTYVAIDDIESLNIIYDLYANNIIPIVTNETNKEILLYLGLYYKLQGDCENMLKFYLMAIDKKCIIAMRNLAYYYKTLNDHDNMLEYYMMAINLKDSKSMTLLASYYEEQKDNNQMCKYYLMAVEQKNNIAMNNLGNYYQSVNDHDNMFKYYLMAIDQNSTESMNHLASYYAEIKDHDNMLKYSLMAIERKFPQAMYSLSTYYWNQWDMKNALKYSLMAVEHKNYSPFPRLVQYYLTNDCDVGINLFNDLYMKGVPDAESCLAQLLHGCNLASVTMFLKNMKDIKVQFDAQKKDISDMKSYITELELLPDGPKYMEAKQHFESISAIKMTI
jgi:tetratricopeptide (TPR) repeat protein